MQFLEPSMVLWFLPIAHSSKLTRCIICVFSKGPKEGVQEVPKRVLWPCLTKLDLSQSTLVELFVNPQVLFLSWQPRRTSAISPTVPYHILGTVSTGQSWSIRETAWNLHCTKHFEQPDPTVAPVRVDVSDMSDMLHVHTLWPTGPGSVDVFVIHFPLSWGLVECFIRCVAVQGYLRCLWLALHRASCQSRRSRNSRTLTAFL